MFFKNDRPVCNHLNVNFIKNYSQNHFFVKKVDFCIFNPKNFEVKGNCSKTLLNVCQLKFTYTGKNHFNFISVWSELMSLKSDQLELGFSIERTLKLFHIMKTKHKIHSHNQSNTKQWKNNNRITTL